MSNRPSPILQPHASPPQGMALQISFPELQDTMKLLHAVATQLAILAQHFTAEAGDRTPDGAPPEKPEDAPGGEDPKGDQAPARTSRNPGAAVTALPGSIASRSSPSRRA